MSRSTDAISREYQTALGDYWEGRPQTAIEHLTQQLAENPDHSNCHQLYRLWIEILADLGETDTLRFLSQHVFHLGVMQGSDQPETMAIRGMIHFEIDDFAGAQLFASAVADSDDPYSQELLFMVRQRLNPGKFRSKLLQNYKGLTDFYHLKTAAINAHQCGDHQLFTNVLKRMNKIYPEAPTYLLFSFHHAVDTQNFVLAESFAHQLLEKYPAKFDFNVYAAFASMKTGDFETAVGILEKAVDLGADADLDIVAMLGVCYARLYETDPSEEIRELCDAYLSKSSEMLAEAGMSSVYQSFFDSNLREAGEDTADMKTWMIKLDQAEYHRIRGEDRDLARIKRMVDENAQPGDLVFFVGDDYRSKESWRLGAVYQVGSAATWDPIDGYISWLDRVAQPESAVEIDVEFVQKKVESGIIELDEDAIDVIAEAVRDHQGEDGILEHLERLRLSS